MKNKLQPLRSRQPKLFANISGILQNRLEIHTKDDELDLSAVQVKPGIETQVLSEMLATSVYVKKVVLKGDCYQPLLAMLGAFLFDNKLNIDIIDVVALKLSTQHLQSLHTYWQAYRKLHNFADQIVDRICENVKNLPDNINIPMVEEFQTAKLNELPKQEKIADIRSLFINSVENPIVQTVKVVFDNTPQTDELDKFYDEMMQKIEQFERECFDLSDLSVVDEKTFEQAEAEVQSKKLFQVELDEKFIDEIVELSQTMQLK